jgi:hypothetical protein
LYICSLHNQYIINNPAHLNSFFLTGAQDSHLQTVTIQEATYIQLRRRPPEDEQGNARVHRLRKSSFLIGAQDSHL